MKTKHYSLLFITVLFTQSISAQNFKLQNIELDFNDNSIGRCLQLQLQVKTGPLYTSIGLRYHLKQRLSFDHTASYYQTMYPINFIQRFGPILKVIYEFQPKNFYASFFCGFKTELAFMARRLINRDGTGILSPRFLHTKSPMIRWDNLLIVGSIIPVSPKIKFRIYAGVGGSGLFRIVEENHIFLAALNGRTSDYATTIGCGLTYNLFDKNEVNTN